MCAKIGIIGGSGLYDLPFINKVKSVKVSTPYGSPSSEVDIGTAGGNEIYFIARHGKRHEFPAHVVNYRANISALKSLGVERIISVQTVGSLKEDYRPGDIVIPDQFIDFTKKREYSFYNGGRSMHVSLANPFCPQLRSQALAMLDALYISHKKSGTYICIEGPRFSTRAESRYFSQFADIIGMTLVPEVVLAKEMELCYMSIAMITDYDAWKETAVTADEVVSVMNLNIEKAYKLLEKLLPEVTEEYTCMCHEALKNAEV